MAVHMDMVGSKLEWDRQYDRAAVDVAHKMLVRNFLRMLIVAYECWKKYVAKFSMIFALVSTDVITFG